MCVQMYFKRQFAKYKLQIVDLLSGGETLQDTLGA